MAQLLMTQQRTPAEDIRSRHHLVANWEQTLLAEGSITIVGDGLVGRLVALGGAALGVGTGCGWITVMAGPRAPDPPFCEPEGEDAAVQGIARAVESRYPDCSVCSVPFPPHDALAAALARPSGIVVACPSEAGGPRQIEGALELAWRWGAQLIVALTEGSRVSIAEGIRAHRLAQRHAALARGPECGGSFGAAVLAAGIILGEVRRLLMPMPLDSAPGWIGIETPPLRMEKTRGIVMVGAGASGSAAAVGLLPHVAAGSRLSIWDPDLVEPSNRSRSWFFEQAGEAKADALARGMRRFAASASVSPVRDAADRTLLDREGGCDVVLLNTDNWSSRAEADKALAGARGRVAFNVGTSPGGAVAFAMGGGAACLRCRRPDLDDLVAQERERLGRPDSCANQPQGSHIVTNMIGGGLQVMMLERYLSTGKPERAATEYNPGHPARLLRRRPQECGCY